MYLGTGLGFTPARKNKSSALIKSYNFSTMTTPPSDISNIRIGGGWYQDNQGLIHHETQSNTIRFGTIYGSARGALVEIAAAAHNLYARPSAGTINDHLSAGQSIAQIINDSSSPCINLNNGSQIWEFDNSAGASDVDIEWIGTISSGKASATCYAKTISGADAILSISGNGSETIGHSVSGYTLHKCEDRSVSGAEQLRVTIPAGSIIRVACVNFQSYDVATSFIDTAGAAVTRNGDDLNGSDASWWSGVQSGTFLIDFTHLDDDAETAHIFEVRNSAINNHFTLWHGSGVTRTTMKVNGTNHVSANTDGLLNGTRVRMAVSYEEGRFIQSRNGFTDIDQTPTSVPDTISFTSAPYPLSFLSINRSGAAPLSGIMHSFSLYNRAFGDTKLNAMTNPNTSSELWVAMFGDSNLLRWQDLYDAQPQQRFIDYLAPFFSSVNIINKGDSSSAANYTGAQAQGVDYWSGNNDIGGGTSWLQAIGPDTNGGSILDNTQDQKRKIDYVILNLAAGDIVSISSGNINKAEYKASLENVMDITEQELGSQIKFIMQYPPNANNPSYTNEAMQDVRDAMREIVTSDPRVIGGYELYDVTRVDNVHPDENGFNIAAERAANIILADLGVEDLIAPPKLSAASYNGNTVTLTLSEDVSGDDPSPFRVEVNTQAETINNVLTSGNKVTLILDGTIANGSDVKLWVGYGQMSTMTPANCIRGLNATYPIASLADYTVTQA